MSKENIEMAHDGTDVDAVSVHTKRRNVGYFIGKATFFNVDSCVQTLYTAFPFVTLVAFLRRHAKQTQLAAGVCLFIGYWVFTGFALSINYREGLVLLIVGVIVCVATIWETFKHIMLDNIQTCCQLSRRKRRLGGFILSIGFFAGVVIFVLVDCLTATPQKSQNLLGLGTRAFLLNNLILLCLRNYVVP